MASHDQELILRAQGGDQSAFEQLVCRYDRQVLALAARFGNSPDDAKDIYQEVFIRVYHGLRRFQSRSEFPTWLYRITTNVCLTHREQRKRSGRLAASPQSADGVEGDPLMNVTSTDPSPEQHTVDADVAEKIAGAIKILSPQQKIVFTLRHYQGYKLKEIAGMMHCTEGTVKRYLFAATQRIREELEDVAKS